VYGAAGPSEEYLAGLNRKLDVEVTQLSHETCEFEVKGITAPLANALRRILLSEVPSIAIETVYIHINTSIIQDEVLSHR
jgi:DNA-directed RNA polymerase I and III subunit RPAC1